MTDVVPTSSPQTALDTSTIPGWGVDADPGNDPTYPYRERTSDDHSGSWPRPERQLADVEILQSIEHKQRPAVVGTSTPPAGLSGALRRLAYRKSESNLVHWMLLIGADRPSTWLKAWSRTSVADGCRTCGRDGHPGREWQHNKRGAPDQGRRCSGARRSDGVCPEAALEWATNRRTLGAIRPHEHGCYCPTIEREAAGCCWWGRPASLARASWPRPSLLRHEHCSTRPAAEGKPPADGRSVRRRSR
jgi:hypothetical protein